MFMFQPTITPTLAQLHGSGSRLHADLAQRHLRWRAAAAGLPRLAGDEAPQRAGGAAVMASDGIGWLVLLVMAIPGRCEVNLA